MPTLASGQDLANYGADEMIAEAIRNGDLRQYAKEIEGDLRKVERVRWKAAVLLPPPGL